MWQGYWSLNSFDENVPARTVYLDPEAEMFNLKVTTSGHEFDNATNCAEFCQKTHWIDINNVKQYEWEIIDECADNPLYPQGGTWIYDRAGWCPGAKVTERNWEITPFIQADSVILDYNCEYDQYGAYSVSSYFVSYSGPNFTLDAAIDEVISPNSYKRHGRYNPLCSRPEIIIQNTGSDTLFSLDIIYGPQSGIMQTFQWEGILGFLEKDKNVSARIHETLMQEKVAEYLIDKCTIVEKPLPTRAEEKEAEEVADKIIEEVEKTAEKIGLFH